MTTSAPIRVFVSYAHDPSLPGHDDQALALANSLRARGIEANIDRYVEHTSVFWPRWMADQIKFSDFVLCLASPLYRERFEQVGDPSRGRGARWEGLIVTEEMYYDIPGGPTKFVAVLLDGATTNDIPDVLHPFGYTHYVLPNDDELLYRRLTGQPMITAPPLGPLVLF